MTFSIDGVQYYRMTVSDRPSWRRRLNELV